MSEATRDLWALAVSTLLAAESERFRGDILDLGGGAALFARSLPGAALKKAKADTLAGPASYDGAVSVSKLQFAEDPAADVAAAAAACRPGSPVLLLVPHALLEDLADARHAFTLKGLRAMATAAGLEVDHARAVSPPGRGVLRRELEAFMMQSPRQIPVADDLVGWVELMDEQRPMLLVCVAVKPR